MDTNFKYQKVAPGRYSVFVGESVAKGTRIGTVVDNGSRKAYGRQWVAIHGGREIGRTSSRTSAAHILLDSFGSGEQA